MSGADLGVEALLGVGLASAGTAAAGLLAVHRWSDQDGLARTKARAQAHLLEFRLFTDDPPLILTSFRALLADNVRMMKLLLTPLLILAVPMVLVLWQLDALYGRAPLPVGEPAVVSAESPQDWIAAPEGLIVETKPIHIRATGETIWRIRPLRKASGILRAGPLHARIVAGPGIAYLPEPLFGQNKIRIEYPRATMLGMHWLVWFFALSAMAGLVLRRPLRVTF